METKKRRRALILCIVFIIVVAALYVYLYLLPSISGSLKTTYIVEYGLVQATDEARCIVVRDEEVQYADRSGTISYYSKETEKTRKGFAVADIYSGGSKVSMYCPTTGFVSYYMDGYESYFVPDTLADLKIDDYANLNIVPENAVKNEVVVGDQVYKLIKSNTWYLLLIIPEENLELYQIGKTVKINLNDKDVITATVSRFLGDGTTRVVVTNTKNFYENFAKLRCLNVRIAASETEGFFIPTAAIATEEEKPGVYVLGVDNEYTFKEIDTLVPGEEYTLISGDGKIKLYDEILRDAKHI